MIKNVAIIGGGIAGTACAYALGKLGVACDIYDANDDLAGGPSGNDAGLYSPRPSAFLSPEGRFYKAAFELALQEWPGLDDIDWQAFGVLYLMTDEKKERRYRKMAENWGWGEDMLRLVDAGKASEIAGVPIEHEALYYPRSGSVSPRRLCRAYAAGANLHLGQEVKEIPKADAVVMACRGGAQWVMPELPMNSVRGQATIIKQTEKSAPLKAAVCYSGHVAPAVDGVHVVGATFQPWLSHTDILPEDDVCNINKMEEAIPSIAGGYEVAGHKAGLRTATKDHFPIIGHARDNIYLSAGHGSHGILSTLLGGFILAAQITGRDLPVDDEVMAKLSPHRF